MYAAGLRLFKVMAVVIIEVFGGKTNYIRYEI